MAKENKMKTEKDLKKFMKPHGKMMAKIIQANRTALMIACASTVQEDADILGKAHFSTGVIAGIGVTLDYLKNHPEEKP